MSKKVKIVDLLVEIGQASGVEEARALIMAGKVIVGERRVDKAGDLVSRDQPVRVKSAGRFVSRAGDKLLSAINYFELAEEFTNKTCLDVGSSTGGFTDYMLQHNAGQIFTVDVGTNQLDWKIRNNLRYIQLKKPTSVIITYQRIKKIPG